jgi:hypothetical protein
MGLVPFTLVASLSLESGGRIRKAMPGRKLRLPLANCFVYLFTCQILWKVELPCTIIRLEPDK